MLLAIYRGSCFVSRKGLFSFMRGTRDRWPKPASDICQVDNSEGSVVRRYVPVWRGAVFSNNSSGSARELGSLVYLLYNARYANAFTNKLLQRTTRDFCGRDTSPFVLVEERRFAHDEGKNSLSAQLLGQLNSCSPDCVVTLSG